MGIGIKQEGNLNPLLFIIAMDEGKNRHTPHANRLLKPNIDKNRELFIPDDANLLVDNLRKI